MNRGQVIDLLSQLPDGVYISGKGKVAKIENGIVTELVDSDVTAQRIGTIHEPPGQNDGS